MAKRIVKEKLYNGSIQYRVETNRFLWIIPTKWRTASTLIPEIWHTKGLDFSAIFTDLEDAIRFCDAEKPKFKNPDVVESEVILTDKTPIDTPIYIPFPYSRNENNKKHIQTWEDLKEVMPSFTDYTVKTPTSKILDKLHHKMIATYKIGVLIDIAYGGLIEYGSQNYYYSIVYDAFEKKFKVLECPLSSRFISFHNKEQAESFIKYNEELLKEYYML